MILYRLEYKRITPRFPGQRGWADFDEFTSLNEAVNRAEYEGKKKHMKDVDFKRHKRPIEEEEVLTDTFFKEKKRQEKSQ